MAFNYVEYRRESDEGNTSSESPEESSTDEEELKAEATEKEPAGASSRENRSQSSRPVEEKPATNSTKETKQNPEHVCESCLEDFGIEKPASRKVRMSGREKWLCDSCLQAAGYKEELD